MTDTPSPLIRGFFRNKLARALIIPTVAGVFLSILSPFGTAGILGGIDPGGGNWGDTLYGGLGAVLAANVLAERLAHIARLVSIARRNAGGCALCFGCARGFGHDTGRQLTSSRDNIILHLGDFCGDYRGRDLSSAQAWHGGRHPRTAHPTGTPAAEVPRRGALCDFVRGSLYPRPFCGRRTYDVDAPVRCRRFIRAFGRVEAPPQLVGCRNGRTKYSKPRGQAVD